MANHKSAVKEHRQSLVRRRRNRDHRARLRTAIKSLRKAIENGETTEAQRLLPGTLALVDKTAKLGAIRDRTASRSKSRLTIACNRLSATA